MTRKQPAQPTINPAVEEGAAAYWCCKRPEANPYKHAKEFSEDRKAWFDGYYEARTNMRLGRVLRQNGL